MGAWTLKDAQKAVQLRLSKRRGDAYVVWEVKPLCAAGTTLRGVQYPVNRLVARSGRTGDFAMGPSTVWIV
jgi:hypothetical protein